MREHHGSGAPGILVASDSPISTPAMSVIRVTSAAHAGAYAAIAVMHCARTARLPRLLMRRCVAGIA